MATTTPNFGWPVPTSTDLVKDGATAIQALGDAIDTSLYKLEGGTTGQILAKATNADMDFAWITNDVGDITAVTAGTGISGGGTSGAVTVTNSMATTITTKGDLVPGTGSGTFARLAAGNNGETLVADSSTSTGLRYQGSQAAAKNILINGEMSCWQRGTSFSVVAFDYRYTADRWLTFNGSACTISQETSTVPSGSQYALKLTGGASTSGYEMWQIIETANAIGLAGQTATLSVFATGTTSSTCTITLDYSTGTDTGSAGSWTAISPASSATSLTSGTFTRVSTTVSVPSTAKSLRVRISSSSLTSGQFQIYGKAQLELGSVATTFTRAGGTIQGELAACQRYYYRNSPATSGVSLGQGSANGSRYVLGIVNLPVAMRIAPTSFEFSALQLSDGVNAAVAVAALAAYGNSPTTTSYYYDGTSGLTQFRNYKIDTSSSSGYLGFSAEL